MEKPKLVSVAGANTKPAPIENKVTAEVKSNAPVPAQTPSNKNQGLQGLTQREAVYNEVMRLIREEKITVSDKQPVKAFLNETHIKKICTALVSGFQTKKIVLKDTESNKKKLADAKAIELYCLGLLNNWLRRDKRLNGVGVAK